MDTSNQNQFLSKVHTLLDAYAQEGGDDRQSLAKKSVELAALLLERALQLQTSREKRLQEEIARMMEDPKGKAFTMQMTDECFRSHETRRVADQLTYLLLQFGVPKYLNRFKQLQLALFLRFGKYLHQVMVPLAKMALRKATSAVILPGEKRALSRHMAMRRKEGVRINLNHLGEAILGEEEAIHRLNIYLHDLEQSDVEYISIKISTIFSQIQVLDWDHTLEILAERLRKLYRKAKGNRFKRPNGEEVVKFVNLDMEEYRDLRLTKELFKKLLDEKEFLDYSAGIVLQAYLPDSFLIQKELTQWAIARQAKGGAPIKIRIVKGANLAMEQVEASLYNWPQTPYQLKSEVDANYKRMVLYGSQPQHAAAVHLGIGSHNLFDIAFALLARAKTGVETSVSFEMLEGMADHIRRAVQEVTGQVLLYCPVATKEDFQSAVAYLIRRLDENTGPDNFLRHSFGLIPESEKWKEQAALFEKSCLDLDKASSLPRRIQDRNGEPFHLPKDSPFQLEPDTDFALEHNQTWARGIVEEWKDKKIGSIPLVIAAETIVRQEKGKGIDPSDPESTLYTYSLATLQDVDLALDGAIASRAKWAATPIEKRCESIRQTAKKMREERARLIGTMMRDGGKTVQETEPEISEAIDFAEYYIRQMESCQELGEIDWQPLGTILIAPPWNFPISIPTGGIVAALLTGNCVIFKPAPEAVLCGWTLVNLFWEAGVPKEVLQFICCEDDPTGSALIQDERLSGVILTGGTSTARLFMKMRPNLPLFAETGGKNSFIITAMADRDLAIKSLVQSAFGHSGQKCSAASLAIVEAEVYDDPSFFKQLKDAVDSLHVGPCWDLASKVVPLTQVPGAILKRGLTSLEEGESWLVKPREDKNNPHLWSPGIKLGVKEGSFMHQTELFGPILGIMRARDIDEAIRFANGTPYGLTAGIHTLDKREISAWLAKIEAGNCYINRSITGAIVERQPFGGCKASSFGNGLKAGGPSYLYQFMHKKEIRIPKETASPSFSINGLTPLISALELSFEELGLWFGSISSYAYWSVEFLKEVDPQQVVGQDNLLRYVPRRHLALRVQQGDLPIDIFRVIAATLSCKVHLEISYDPADSPLPIDGSWDQLLPEMSFTQETEKGLIERIKWGAFERIRLLSAPSSALSLAAAESGTYLCKDPVLAIGRLELLHYLREVAISIDYHRYGNLGTREGEARTPIL